MDIKELFPFVIVKCGTCKFWGTPAETKNNLTFRSCQGIKHDEDRLTEDYKQQQGYFNLYNPYDVEAKQKMGEFFKEHQAVACDGSGYYAALKTKEDFGCILHVPKTEQIST